MGIKVAKFGGSSLADAGQFKKVRDIVAADPSRRYVVPSAPGRREKSDPKVTDLLYLCQAQAKRGVSFDEVFTRVAERFTEIVAGLGLKLDIGGLLREVSEKIASGASADYAASRGEYLNGRILAELLSFSFVDAAELLHFDAQGGIDSAATRAAVGARLIPLGRAVVPGFYGSAHDGEVKTFSRGGSDVTGAVLAQCVGAAEYENWTDVSGLLMADPRIVPNPRHVHAVTYRELRELAYMGAQVLHDEAIFPVREAGIPVHVRNTNDPSQPGTMIVADSNGGAPPSAIAGIAGRKDFTVILVEKALMNREVGFGRRLLECLEAHSVSFEHMPSGIDTISLVIADAQLEGKLGAVLEDIRSACKPDKLEAKGGMALVATVGRGLHHHPGMAARLFSALHRRGINIRMIDQGSSELNLIVGVDAGDFEESVRAIYHEFVG